MNIDILLDKYRFPEETKKIFTNAGIKSLFPPQIDAIEGGILDGKNLLMSVPTAAGKTLIAELCMLKSLVDRQGRCLYIVPLKALAGEKYEDFKEKYSSIGLKVGIATGDNETPDKFLNGYHILIATAEKVDSLLRSRTQWLINNLNVVVLDEIHFINDGSRGPTLEILAARIRQLNPNVQMLALSATVGNAEELSGWLQAELVKSDWRPIPLREGVYFNGKIQFQDGPARLIREETAEDINKLSLDTLRGKGQLLIFVNSRRSAQAVSRQLCKSVSLVLNDEEKKQLALIAKEVVGSQTSSTKICRKLGDAVRHGVAFHHAGLKPKQRKLIEENFKKNIIKIICSTPTLAAGVNLPARRAIIRDFKRFESGLGAAYIPASEYKQCAGRAGRPKYDEYGEAVLMAKSPSETKVLFERYINSDPEPVISKLGNESALRIHILASIVGGYVHDVNDTFDFISHTFMAHQKQTTNLIEIIGHTFEFLEKESFIEKRGFQFYATPFGQYTSRLYLDPFSSIILREGLNKINAGKSFSSIGLLHLICCCPGNPRLNSGKSDTEEIELFASNCQDEFIIAGHDFSFLEDYMLFLSIIKTTMMLSRWIEEEKEEALCDKFNIGPGDVYRHIESARWLLYAAIVFADLFKFKKLTFLLSGLKNRIQYGIKEELIPLAQLKGIGRVRARHLFNKGYTHPTKLKHVSVDELAQVSQIGKTLAQEILDQVLGKKMPAEENRFSHGIVADPSQ